MDNAVISLKDYQGKFNVLVPTTSMEQISPFHRIRVEEVSINPDPDAGDVFKVGSKKTDNGWEDVLSLSKPAVLKLAAAAGIVWNWNETKVLSATSDYVLYQAVGAIRKASGEWLPLKATKEIDLNVIEDETYESNLKKAKKVSDEKRDGLSLEEWAQAQTKSNMIQWRKNKLMRAETGAMLRVVRALLSIKHQYSPSELKKPFAVPTVDFSPDYNDPEVKRAVLSQGMQSANELFGCHAPQLLPGEGKAFTPPSELPDMPVPVDADEVEDESPLGDDSPHEDPPDIFGGLTCADCGNEIKARGPYSAESIAGQTAAKYNRPLCWECASKAKDGEQK